MVLIDQSVQYFPQELGIKGIYKQIERVGRTCYKSEEKITEDSAEPFVNRLINSGHLSMCEHGTVYMEGAIDIENIKFWQVANSPYSKVVCDSEDNKIYVTTNLRVIIENNAMELLDKYLCEPTGHHAKRITLKFVTSIGVSREGNRHRAFSVAEQSTRYCNYCKDKFNNNVSFVYPSWYDSKVGNMSKEMDHLFNSWSVAENNYKALIKLGWKPQQAREVLPLSTATEVVYTAFEGDWKHFFDLRYRETTGPAHPNMKEIATMAHDAIINFLGKDL